jgi:hypothetical protein
LEKIRRTIERIEMDKAKLKKTLKPLIKECIREALFEDGILSGIITEVAKGLNDSGNLSIMEAKQKKTPKQKKVPQQHKQTNEGLMGARQRLEETKRSLQESVGLGNVFEGTTPMRQAPQSQQSQYGAMKDRDPGDAGVDISGILKMTGGWKV